MNILRYLEIPRMAEAEDGTPEPEEVVAENALAGEAPAPEPEVIPEQEPEAAPVDHGNKGKVPWYMQRIHEETNKRANIETELAQTKREKAEALAMLERSQQGGDKPAPATLRSDTPDFETAVEARAAAKLLFKDSTDVRLAGQKEFPDFADSLGILTAVGATSDEFVGDVIDTDKDTAHKMFDFLAKNPERAAALVNMTSKRRVAELTRISMSELAKPAAAAAAPAAPAAKPAAVSKVPAPKPVIDAAGAVEEVAEDSMSDQQWSAWRKKQLAKKYGN